MSTGCGHLSWKTSRLSGNYTTWCAKLERTTGRIYLGLQISGILQQNTWADKPCVCEVRNKIAHLFWKVSSFLFDCLDMYVYLLQFNMPIYMIVLKDAFSHCEMCYLSELNFVTIVKKSFWLSFSKTKHTYYSNHKRVWLCYLLNSSQILWSSTVGYRFFKITWNML